MSSKQSETLLTTSGLVKRFGVVTAVWNVDLRVSSGDFVSIFGPNGAGKSTLLRMLATVSRPTEGEISFPSGSLSRRENVGYVSHQSLLYSELSGLENLIFFGRLYSLSDPATKAEALLEQMNLKRARHQLARNYSSGMKQRLKIARALLHEPSLLLLDEPYAGLDQHGSRLLSEVLEQLKKAGRTILLITHNLSEGLELSSRVMIMNRGEIVYEACRKDIEEEGFESLYFGLVEG